MKRIITICLFITMTGAWPTILSASPTIVNFDDATHMEVINNKYAASGITFSGMSGGDVIAYADGSSFPGRSPVSDPQMAYAEGTYVSPFEGIRLDFSTPVSSLSLYGCDYGGTPVTDQEIATLAAYDSGGNLLGSTTVATTRGTRSLPEGDMPTDIAFLSLSGIGNIAYAEFTYTDTVGFFGIDDVEFSPIPAPGAILLGGIGVGLVGWLRRRRTL
jgi:hypothetical protein